MSKLPESCGEKAPMLARCKVKESARNTAAVSSGARRRTRLGFKSGRLQSNQEDLMQKMQTRRCLEALPIVGAAANIGGGKMPFVRRQADICGEGRANIDLRGFNLALHGRDIDANAAAMQFTRSVVWHSRVVRVVTVLTAIDRQRWLAAIARRGRRAVVSVTPAATPET